MTSLLCEIQKAKLIDTESKMAVARGKRAREMRRYLSKGFKLLGIRGMNS